MTIDVCVYIDKILPRPIEDTSEPKMMPTNDVDIVMVQVETIRER